MIKRFSLALLAATAIGVVASQGASAADMPMKAPPMAPPVPLFNWTGVYVGGFFGAGLSRNQFSAPNGISAPFASALDCSGCTGFGLQQGNLGSHNGLGPLGGFTLGYRYQPVGSPWLVGVEGQFAFADLQGSHTNAASFSLFTPKFPGGSGSICGTKFRSCLINANTNSLISSKVKDLATIDAVFGITSGPQDRTLWYVKGGAAYARTSFTEADSGNMAFTQFHFTGGVVTSDDSFDVAASDSLSATKSRWGWNVGTGVEFGLWGNWSTKIEYDFLDFGSYDVNLSGTGSLTCTTPGRGCDFGTGSTSVNRTIHVKQQIHMVQVGLNYKFDWANWGH